MIRTDKKVEDLSAGALIKLAKRVLSDYMEAMQRIAALNVDEAVELGYFLPDRDEKIADIRDDLEQDIGQALLCAGLITAPDESEESVWEQLENDLEESYQIVKASTPIHARETESNAIDMHTEAFIPERGERFSSGYAETMDPDED
jgi:hypothetical protein